MNLIDFAFRLGIIFSVFGFLWILVRSVFRFIRPNKIEKNVIEEYSFKFVQYFFLADVTFLFCLDHNESSKILPFQLFISAFILILYFIGKLQNNLKRGLMFQGIGDSLKFLQPVFNLRAEIASIVFALGMFTFFSFYPNFAYNPISNWFYDSILGIEKTPIIGFVFKIIGFFILLSLFNKILNGFFYLISGKPLITSESSFRTKKENDNSKFDDYEEL